MTRITDKVQELQIDDTCEIIMAMNQNLDEYVMLRMYEENIVKRGFLLRIPFVTLQQIESDSWKYPISKEEKPDVRTMIQIEIISKIMMYVEDFAIMAQSLMCQRSYYSFLTDKSVDLGSVVGDFIKRLDQLSYDEICKVMSYLKATGFEDYDELLRKHIDYHVDKMKNKLKEIKDFSTEAHHGIYKRFKHAGIPIVSAFPVKFAASDPLRQFDSFNIVSMGLDPLKDIIIVPYSAHLVQKYDNFIKTLQEVLRELVSNRRICLERGIQRMIPIQYDKDLFSPQEIESMKVRIEHFYSNYPIKKRPKLINIDLNETEYKNILEKIHWYRVGLNS